MLRQRSKTRKDNPSTQGAVKSKRNLLATYSAVVRSMPTLINTFTPGPLVF